MRFIDCFSRYHPFPFWIYFVAAVILSGILLQPAFLAVNVASAVLCSFLLKKEQALVFYVKLLPFPILIGICIFIFWRAGTPISLLGRKMGTAGGMYWALTVAGALTAFACWIYSSLIVLPWEVCFHLLSQVFPKTALRLVVFSRLVMRIRKKFSEFIYGQKCLGITRKESGRTRVLLWRLKILSAAVPWAIESFNEMAASMKARGYGLKGRTSFSQYNFRKRDGFYLTIILLLLAFLLKAAMDHGLFFTTFPFQSVTWNWADCLIVYAVLCNFPVLLYLAVKCRISWFRSKYHKIKRVYDKSRRAL